jgi:hypothetical protein
MGHAILSSSLTAGAKCRRRELTAFRTAVATMLLPLSGCLPTLTTFDVPPEVAPGKILEIRVEGRSPAGSLGRAGCVLQLPSSFTVLGAAGWGDIDRVTVDASLLAGFTPEPGQSLIAYSAGYLGNPPADYAGGMSLFVRAPAVGGPFLFKVIVAAQDYQTGGWTVTDPPAFTSFATLGSAYVRSVNVVEQPAQGMVIESVLLRDGTSLLDPYDFDGDGRVDVVESVIRGLPGISQMNLWTQRDGTWAQVQFTSPPSVDALFRLADLNRDGYPDIIDATGRVLFGDGGAHWTAGPQVPINSTSAGYFGVGDINGDGWPDVAFVTLPPGTYYCIQAFLNNNGTGWVPVNNGLPATLIGSTWGSPMICDVNGDGNQDLVLFPYCWYGDGAGNWSASPLLQPPSSSTTRVVACDLDGDGKAELLQYLNSAVTVWEWRPQGWQQHLITLTTFNWTAFPMDWDGDGLTDIVVGPSASSSSTGPLPFVVWRNMGGLNFQQMPGASMTWFHPYYTGATSVDFDGNGIDDLIVFERYWAAGSETSALKFLQSTRAGASAFGTACAASGLPAPLLQAIGAPSRGNLGFVLRLTGGATNGPALLWFGASKRIAFGQNLLPFDLTALGAPGCTLLSEPAVLLPVVCNASGIADLPVPIPNVPALLRQTFFVQGAVERSGVNPLGLLFSQSLALRVQ